MKNTVSLTRFFDQLGCPLRIGYYWSAASEDKKRIVFTLWDDRLNDDEYVLMPHDSKPWMKRPGAREIIRHVPLTLVDGVEVLGVLCHAVDPGANPRVREYYDEKTILVLKVQKRIGATVAVVVGEVDAEFAKNGKIAGKIKPVALAIDDLDDIPYGAASPVKLDFSGFKFKRNRMVRDYVIKRANGRCEYCGSDGFLMENGNVYLEAHHVMALGKNGPDTVMNVIALCADHHRQAHFAINALELNSEMLTVIKKIESQMEMKASAR